jgi:hypothetical protein
MSGQTFDWTYAIKTKFKDLNICGAYLLRCADLVLYVGQSKNIAERLRQHRSSGNNLRSILQQYPDKVLVEIVECGVDQLDELEKSLIRDKAPCFNQAHNKDYDDTALLIAIEKVDPERAKKYKAEAQAATYTIKARLSDGERPARLIIGGEVALHQVQELREALATAAAELAEMEVEMRGRRN